MHAVFVQTAEQQAEHVPRWLEPVDPATCRLEAARQAGNQRRLLEAEPEGVGEAAAIRGHGEGGRAILVPRQHLGPGSDNRKSTRLNSSHQIISYAVFCMKKKNGEMTHARSNHVYYSQV